MNDYEMLKKSGGYLWGDVRTLKQAKAKEFDRNNNEVIEALNRIIKEDIAMAIMRERYGRSNPCILDKDIFDRLPEDCKDYLVAWDYFLHYDDNNAITLATWESEEKFETIEELTEYLDTEIELATEAGYWE